MALENLHEAGCSANDDSAVHSVRPASEMAAQPGCSEFEEALETVGQFNARILASGGLLKQIRQLACGRLVRIVVNPPANSFNVDIHVCHCQSFRYHSASVAIA